MNTPLPDSGPHTIAAIDIGTNSAHLVVAEMSRTGAMRVRDSDKVTLRLGAMLDKFGNISAKGIEQTVEALTIMQKIMAPYNATVRVVATYAVREAPNYRVLLQRIVQKTGLRVEVINGIEEARLTFLGMRYGLGLSGETCLGLDIGGGSTEIIIAKDDETKFVSSFKLGAVLLTHQYFTKGGYTPAAVRAIKDHIKSTLAPLDHETESLSFSKAIAASGTAKALAFVHSALFANSTVSDPNGYQLPSQNLSKTVEILSQKLAPDKIRETTGLDSSRSEIILAGALIMEEVSRVIGVKNWIITSFGLREGLVADTFYRHHSDAMAPHPDIQWSSVLDFAKRLKLDLPHAEQVTKLAERLYELLRPLAIQANFAASLEDKLKLLRAAAYLREGGKFLSAPQYHRHSQYLIKNSRLLGFTESERLMTGLIARFHRKALPTRSHPECAELSELDLQHLRFLAAILRLAAALDRTRHHLVKEINITLSRQKITLHLYHKKGEVPDVEVYKAQLELSALEKSFERKLDLHLVEDPS